MSKKKKNKQNRMKRTNQRKSSESNFSSVNIMSRPPFAMSGAPDGFRSIGMAQAMMVYAEPIMELVAKKSDINDINDAVQVSSLLWNYALGVEKGTKDQKMEASIINILSKKCKLNAAEAKQFLDKMVTRRSYLFPTEIQPKIPLIMFVRKENPVAIAPFDFTRINLKEIVVPPDAKDKDMISNLKKLESDIASGHDYDTYENLLFMVKDKCHERFAQWLANKGVQKDVDLLVDCIDIYIDFVYAYIHDKSFIFASISENYLQEFFEDFLLRKVLVSPEEYVYWPVGIRLFYQFLKEKEYLQNPEKIIQTIQNLEPHFLEVLKKQFS